MTFKRIFYTNLPTSSVFVTFKFIERKHTSLKTKLTKKSFFQSYFRKYSDFLRNLIFLPFYRINLKLSESTIIFSADLATCVFSYYSMAQPPQDPGKYVFIFRKCLQTIYDKIKSYRATELTWYALER